MAQNAAGAKSSAPTSADACMSIVHSLMCYRQGAGDRGESEQFSRRAIESLVKKLKEKRDELDSLISAITTNGSHPTKCVTIPRTLDGRLQVAGRKCFPHVIYARIWRWPDLHKNELRRAEGCHYAFDLKVDSVCVNPYHYVRDVSLGVDLSALTLHHVKSEQMGDGQWMHGADHPDTYRYNYNSMDSNYSVPSQENYAAPIDNTMNTFDHQMRHPSTLTVLTHPPPLLPPQNGEGLLMKQVESPMMPSVPPVISEPMKIDNKVNENLKYPKSYTNDNSQPGTPINPSHEWVPPQPIVPIKKGTLDYTDQSQRLDNLANPMGHHNASPVVPYQPFAMSDWRPIQSRNNYEPVSKLPLPEHWCSITYYELDVQVGEIFKVPTCCKFVSVDGYVEQNDKHRFCLGALSNVHRTDISERARLHIGRGIQLQLMGEGDVYLRCVSQHSIFIQSHYLDWTAGKAPGEVVHKMHKGAEFKVFDLKQFYHEMKVQANANGVGGGGVHGGHLAPAISHATAAAGIGIDDLRRLCILRLSFVKGWGADYNRKTIKETPCWVEIQLHRALQVLDEVLLHTIPTESVNKRQQQIMLACS